MKLDVTWLLLGFISLALAQDNAVGEIKLTFREEKIPIIINHLVNNSLETQNISTVDIIQLTKLDSFNLEQTLAVLHALNVSVEEAFNVENLEITLKTLNISFQTFLRDWNNITNTTLTSQILQALNISDTNFFMIYTVQIENIYNVLRGGIYDKIHFDAALAAAGKSSSEIFTATRDLFARYASSIPSSQFMDILKSKGWKTQTTANLLKAANITLQDIYNVNKFRDIFTEVINNLNANLSIAVFVAKDQIAVHKITYNNIKNNIDGYTIKPSIMGLEIELYKAEPLGSQIVGLKTKQATNDFVLITDTYNVTKNCSYITILNGQPVLVNVLVDSDDLKIIKTDKTAFQLGSPLVCNGYLYGLAKNEDSNNIEFDRFYEKDETINDDNLDYEEPDKNDSSASGTLSLTYLIFFVQLVLCNILL